MKTIVVVPDGLAYDPVLKVACSKPSFVYRAVLDGIIEKYRDKKIILAPANNFGGAIFEQEAAKLYLKEQLVEPICIPSQSKKYIDTRGNARHLREWLSLRDMWPYQPIILISAKHHARRAALCFRKEGFKIAQIVSVPYAINHDEFIVPRLWYYKHPNLHILYELLAFIYDFLRPSNTKLSQG